MNPVLDRKTALSNIGKLNSPSISELMSDFPMLAGLGNLAVLEERQKMGFVSSVRCPGNLILRTYDLAQRLRDEERIVVGGFHSPMEKECLFILLKGKQPIVVFLARSLDGYRVPPEWRQALTNGRLLILSAFPNASRPTVELAIQRNLLVAALADEIFIAHAQPGSKTETLALKVVTWGKPLLTFNDPDNEVLLSLGAEPVPVAPK